MKENKISHFPTQRMSKPEEQRGQRTPGRTVPFPPEGLRGHHVAQVTPWALDLVHICHQNVPVFVKKKVHLTTNYLRVCRMLTTIYIFLFLV